MSNVLIPVLYGLTGVCVYAAVHHALIAWRHPVDRTHLLFAVVCAATAAYALAKAGAYQAGTPQDVVFMRRWELSFGMIFFVLLPWFVREYAGLRSLRLPLGVSLFMIGVLAANLLLSSGPGFAGRPEFVPMTLPPGGQVTDLRVPGRGIWYQAGWLGMLLVFAYSLYAAWRQYHNGERRQARTLAIAIVVFMALVLFNRRVNTGGVEFTHTAEFGFLSLLFLMNHRLLYESRKFEHELNALQQQVLHADRVTRIGALSASLAHELSQPLTAVLSNAQAGLRFIERGGAGMDEYRDILQDIVRDDQRAIAIISGLRAMLRQKSTVREQIGLADVVTEALDLIHDEILRRGVHCERHLEGGCIVLADKVQIEQVILNLVMNALDALDGRPAGQRQLWVSVTSDGNGQARVAIRDSGMGLPPNQSERIFESFYSTKSQGLGMGLALCRSIIESHGGRIWANSNTDQGATAQFILPMVKEDMA